MSELTLESLARRLEEVEHRLNVQANRRCRQIADTHELPAFRIVEFRFLIACMHEVWDSCVRAPLFSVNVYH